MQRFVSRRSSSSVDLDPSSLDDMRTERAAIAPVCWSELATSQTAAVRSCGNAQSPDRSHTRRSPTPTLPGPPQPRQPLHSLKTSPAAAVRSAAKSTSTPTCATGFSTYHASGGHNGQNGNGACSSGCAKSSACVPGCSTEIHHNTPYRWKRSSPRAAQLGRLTLLSPACVTRLGERIMRVTHLSAVTIRGLAHD